MSSETAEVRSVVRVRDPDGEDEFILVGPEEADAAHGRVSIDSPFGRAMLGRRAGDRVTIATPAGPRRALVLAVRHAVAASIGG